jgi:hypothetical protein
MGVLNAMAGLGGLANPNRTLDDEIVRLVRLHGADAVRDAVRRKAMKRKGRKAESDWSILKERIEQDAIDWLDGLDPFALRSNYSVAKEFAKNNPGHSIQATHRRIMGKLARKRKWMVFVSAWLLAEKDRPFSDYFRAASALMEISPGIEESVRWQADRHRGQIERYKEEVGEPDPALSIEQIENALRSRPVLPVTNALAAYVTKPGLFGSGAR